jgi:hypothetical protein
VFGLVFGTSASSPVVGALITLVNDARIAAGKKPVGFINPAVSLHPSFSVPSLTCRKHSFQIYSDAFAAGFNDITSGGNQGCGMIPSLTYMFLNLIVCRRNAWFHGVSSQGFTLNPHVTDPTPADLALQVGIPLQVSTASHVMGSVLRRPFRCRNAQSH